MERKTEKRQKESQHLSRKHFKSSKLTHKGFRPGKDEYRKKWKST